MSEKDHSASLAAVEGARSASESDAATARHTPGPWEVGFVMRGEGRCVRVYTGEGSFDCDESGDVFETDVANAHLIAAAPEMYEILKAVATEIAGGSWRNLSGENAQKALRAIAKAEGR